MSTGCLAEGGPLSEKGSFRTEASRLPQAVPPVVSATLRDWMASHADEVGNRIACVGPHGATTYSDLHSTALSLAKRFRSLGIARGDVIAVQLPNGLEFLLSYLAAGYAGAILQTVHMPYRAAEVVPLLQHSRAKVLICQSSIGDFSPAELVLSRRNELPDLTTAITVGPDAPPGALAFDAALTGSEKAPCSLVDEPPEAADPFLLLYTSGTTAAPKGVPIPYYKFLTNARYSAHELSIDGTSVLLSGAPFTHLYGIFSINLALSKGATIAILPVFSPKALAGAIEDFRPTGIFVAPAHMAACLKDGLLTDDSLGPVRFVLISGSVCPPDLARSVQKLMPNGAVCQLWGMSEMQAGTFTRPGDPEDVRLTTAGRATPGTDIRVVDDTGATLVGAEGELQVRGISVFDGYLSNPLATNEAFTADGWYRTGDLAKIDVAGNLEITGRLKEIINRGGVKFNPADVEAALVLHPAIASCAIVPMPDPVLGERACCFVVAKPDATINLEDMRTWLAGKSIAKNKWPERIELIDEMPMTPTRKVKKAELAALATRLL
jgi:cyclohexanecarboxylate-CoA ligase